MSAPDIDITVSPQHEDHCRYRACWPDGETLLAQVPEAFLDLVGFMLARRLLEQGYAVERILIVRLEGAAAPRAARPSRVNGAPQRKLLSARDGNVWLSIGHCLKGAV